MPIAPKYALATRNTITVFFLGPLLLATQSHASEEKTTRNSWVGRVMPELSLTAREGTHRGHYERNGTSAKFWRRSIGPRIGPGIRLELGYLIRFRRVGLYPRIGGSFGWTLPTTARVAVLGTDLEYKHSSHWWNVGPGAEVQFLDGRVGAGLFIGIAGMNPAATTSLPPGLSVERSGISGAMVRAEFTARLAHGDHFLGGIAAWGTALSAGPLAPLGARAGMSLVLEWDTVPQKERYQ